MKTVKLTEDELEEICLSYAGKRARLEIEKEKVQIELDAVNQKIKELKKVLKD